MNTQQTLQLALSHHGAGRHKEAEALYRQALAADPRHHPAMSLLGALLAEHGDFAQALKFFAQAVTASPTTPEYHNAMGTTLLNMRRPAEAAAALANAVKLRPQYADAQRNLGRALALLGKPDQAMSALQTATSCNPTQPSVHAETANVLRRRGQLDAALAAAQRAVAIDPCYAWGHNILGLVLADRGEDQAAFESYTRAVLLQPKLASAYINIAQLRRKLGQLTLAAADLRTAVRLSPRDAAAHRNLGIVLAESGEADAAIAALRAALSIDPGDDQAHSGLLYTMHCHAGLTPRQRFNEHLRWAKLHAAPLSAAVAPHTNDRAPGRRLRVGYVSADFRQHPVSRFIEPILQSHDRERFDVFCYSDVTSPDSTTARLRQLPLTWRDIAPADDEAVANLIRSDGIDVLVDLAGHTERNRLLVFARKPAPVQFTYLGYPNTTGLTAIDYRLTDAHADPPGEADSVYTEKLVRLPTGFLCYRPPANGPAVQPPPSIATGRITFASFNNVAKLSSAAIAMFSRVLESVKGSRLLLKSFALGDADVIARIVAAFGKHKLAPERLYLRRPEATTESHLGIYNEVDIALDTLPYNGTTTTCEALWMGVPVITLAGDAHVSRVGTSILRTVGLPELVATTSDGYVRSAGALAGSPARLRELREGMRRRLQSSPLLGAAGVTRAIEAAYRSGWDAWGSRR